MYSAARPNPFRIDPQLQSQLYIFQYCRGKCLSIASDPESGLLQRKGSWLLHLYGARVSLKRNSIPPVVTKFNEG